MNANEIDQLINDNINNINIENENNNEDKEYNLILFSDGAHERVKKRSAFGIYVYCKNNKSEYNKYNDTTIIKKIDKDLFFYNKNYNIIYYNYLEKNNQIIKCQNESCNFYAIYNIDNELNGKFCKNHKTENMNLLINYFVYEATNIRAEGFGILYSLIYLKLIIIDNIQDKEELNKALSLDKLENIHDSLKIINKKDYSKYQYKFLIVTDSEFWINVITKWSNNWIKKKLYMDKKNLDIILYINYYLHLLNNNNILIDFKFIRGHADKNKNEQLDIYQKGNIMADKLANKGKERLDLNISIN